MTTKAAGDAVADIRREEMLAAAAQLITERGFSETRIADVAKRAGASPGLVIYYFSTKDNLLTEALRWSERSFYEAADEMLKRTKSLRRRLGALVTWTLLPERHADLRYWGLWLELWAQAFRHPEVKRDRAELDQRWRDLIKRVVHDGVKSGEIEAVDADSFAIMWAALLDGLAVQVALDDPQVSGKRAQKIAMAAARKELGFR